MKKILALLVLATSLAFAQRIVVSPEAIVVNPKPSFNVDVWLNKDSSGQGRPSYDVGENVTISVKVSQDAYVYLFSVKPSGDIQQILPNRYDQSGQNNHLSSGETRTFPPSGANYTFSVEPPRGLSKVIAVASRNRLDTHSLAQFQGNDPFATGKGGQEGFVQNFSIVVKPVPQQDWVTDTALYYVGNQPQTPSYGNLRFTSQPSGAEVYVDGDFVGYTPTNFGTRPGRHDIRVSLSGYDDFTTSINLRPGDTQNVDATLRQVRQTGTVSFTSTPSGADVYVDGNYVGTTPTGRVSLDAGTHTARFSLSGYQDESRDFDLNSGEDRRIDAGMQRAQGSLDVQANVGGAQVFVDGRAVGTVANGTGRFSMDGLDPGQHELTVVAPGFSTFVTTFSVQAGRSTQLSVRQSRL